MDQSPPDQFAEARRLEALRALNLLDTDPDQEFGALVALARLALRTPIVLVALIDEERLWVSASEGTDIKEIPREVSFCNHTIRGRGIFEVTDAHNDPRFADNPLVTGYPDIRFYAGIAIHAADPKYPRRRHAIGAICGIDHRPGKLDAEQEGALRNLGRLAEGLVASRAAASGALRIAETTQRQAVELSRRDRTFREAERMAQIGSWRFQFSDRSLTWSEGIYRLHDLNVSEPPSAERALEFYPPHARERLRQAMADTRSTGEPFDLELDFITASGGQRRVRTVGGLELEDGEPVAMTGVFQDVTERYQLEQSLRRSASIDEVAGIANRNAFNRELEVAMDEAEREKTPLALVLVDLDGFKQVNDTNGHVAGDDVLRAVGQRLHAPWLAESFAARLGGDEFALIVRDPTLCGDIDTMVATLVENLKRPVETGAGPLRISGTAGYAAFGPAIGSMREFIHRADTALYEAKRTERGTARRSSALMHPPRAISASGS
ncbi:diguanylate cyclase [Stakelama sp. CBK3Z-3]|uniref:Diguanylate cyclase n=1 Tax=Stakelama flava TaxID=2860338 RepID=A0ABS6XMA1_9SPHN|nr:diguanylate cyclase [Stakelama flava]MBW4331332.1 diguanylate cyclase [Stakelama flava]